MLLRVFSKNTTATQGIEHNGRHPQSYSDKINKIIEDYDNIGGMPKVLNELNNIKNKLENAPKNSNWKNIL